MRRLGVRGRFASGSDPDAIIVRHASDADADALADLAELDSVRVPPGPLLLAEVDDELRAALSLCDGTVISDPFHLNAEVVALLRDRAGELAD
jgi:ketosteroid isomerase-like protein